MIKVVGIDVDDTLCLTEEACFSLENEVLVLMGRPAMSRSMHRETWGQPLLDAIIVRSPGVSIAQFRAVYQGVIARYVADGRLDHIPSENYRALDMLLALGKRVVLLTSRAEDEVRHMLAPDHELASRVTAVYHKDNTAYHKPDPRAFDELLAEQAVVPAETVYVGDSPGDARAAHERGVHFVASLESGIRQADDFASYRVAAFISRFPDVVGAVMALDTES